MAGQAGNTPSCGRISELLTPQMVLIGVLVGQDGLEHHLGPGESLLADLGCMEEDLAADYGEECQESGGGVTEQRTV